MWNFVSPNVLYIVAPTTTYTRIVPVYMEKWFILLFVLCLYQSMWITSIYMYTEVETFD